MPAGACGCVCVVADETKARMIETIASRRGFMRQPRAFCFVNSRAVSSAHASYSCSSWDRSARRCNRTLRFARVAAGPTKRYALNAPVLHLAYVDLAILRTGKPPHSVELSGLFSPPAEPAQN